MTNTYQDIIERLEKAEGSDRELDCWIAYHADLECDDMSWREKIDKFGIDYCVESASKRTNIWSDVIPYYTASLDASIALCARVLPGAEFEISTMYGAARVSLPINSQNGWETGERRDGNLCLAFLLAIFKALAAQEQSDV